RIFLAALAQFKAEFANDQGRLFAWLAAGLRNMQTTLKLSALVDLAFTASHVALRDAQNVVLPGGSGMVGIPSAVAIDTAKARALMADAQKDGVISKANMPPSPTAGQ